MYKVCIYNNGIETVIHYPTADQEAPHLNKLPLKESLSQIDSLSFSIYTNNPGYNLITELVTKIKVIDTRDNSVRFPGRVLDAKEQMDSSGQFFKDVICEGVLSYLGDTKTRAETFMGAPADFIQWILNDHNAKVEDAKKIQVGNIDVTGSIVYTCSFKTTLETILDVKEKSNIDGDIRVREENGILYLDWLQSFSNNTIDITLGVNMKDMAKDKDVTSLGTRIIPLGANNLTIKDVNSGLDYIEDANAKAVYGTIEKTVQYSDITDPTELMSKCETDLPNYTQPLYVLESTALDLSFISGNKVEQFVLGVNLHIFNPVMNVDDIYKIVAVDLDLLQPYNPKLTIANAPVQLTSTINDLRKTSISNNGVYNGVQVGDDFGIRIVRGDKKVITTLNATEGMSIENDTKKVFLVNDNGNIVANDCEFNDITANRGTYNNIIATEMKTSNTTNYIIAHDQYLEFYHNNSMRMRLGFTPSSISFPRIEFYPESGLGSDPAAVLSTTASGDLMLNAETVATQEWVRANTSTPQP